MKNYEKINTLNECVEIARFQGYNWVAVDSGGEVFGYMNCPLAEPKYDGMEILEWRSKDDEDFDYDCLGKYTGNKDWRNTLRHTGV